MSKLGKSTGAKGVKSSRSVFAEIRDRVRAAREAEDKAREAQMVSPPEAQHSVVAAIRRIFSLTRGKRS